MVALSASRLRFEEFPICQSVPPTVITDDPRFKVCAIGPKHVKAFPQSIAWSLELNVPDCMLKEYVFRESINVHSPIPYTPRPFNICPAVVIVFPVDVACR